MLKYLALAALAIAVPLAPALADAKPDMLVIAHRGASGERPEHTLAAYERAIDQGADYIEPDLVVTKDGVLVARHENEISGTTDVADRAEFAERRVAKMIDGQEVIGWFVEDFTLAELQTLRARERLPQLRAANTRFDGLYQVPTFAEIIALVKAKEAETGRRIGLYPELKHPSFLLEQGFDTAELLVAQLSDAGYGSADDPVFIQSFEVAPLERLNMLTELPLIQLVASEGGPADSPGTTYTDMVMPAGLSKIAEYADGIGADMQLLARPDGETSGVIEAAHDAGLVVHAWTVRKENMFLPEAFRRPGTMADWGCDNQLYDLLQRLGVDGVFTDDPGRMMAFRSEMINGWCASGEWEPKPGAP